MRLKNIIFSSKIYNRNQTSVQFIAAQGAKATPSVIILFTLVPYRQNGNALLILYFEQRHVAAGSE